MSKQKNKFSGSLRWSLWTAYGMKCFRCRKPISFDNCEIARLIPENVTKIVLSSIAKEYDLGSEFNLDGLQNLIPSCRNCKKDRAYKSFRHSAELKSWFEAVREKSEKIDAKIRLIDSEHSEKLKIISEKLERGSVSPEDLERVLRPFIESVETKPRTNLELHLSDSVRLVYAAEGLKMQAASEIRYQKFVEGMVEGGDWRKKSPESLREGPQFGEGRARNNRGGA